MRLARAEGIGPTTYRRLLARYGSAQAAIDALPGLIRGGIAPRMIGRPTAAREFETAAQAGAAILFVDGPGYPPLLALLHDPPPLIAVLGDPARLAMPGIAVVGSRNASAAGRSIADAIAEAAAAAGYAVVSGLARGVDAAAHEGALRAGCTIAAIAGGLDKPYPRENTALQARIAERGAVLSEAPFGTAPQARHFPRRNRIIAGLALGVIVIEAARRSGSLITARFAIENGRELFAVPGSPLDPRCLGSNDLIRQGAHLTETLDDVVANLPAHPAAAGLERVPLFGRGGPPHMAESRSDWQGEIGSSADQDRLRAEVDMLLGPTPTSVDDLIAHCQVSPAAINAILLELELAGRVGFLPGNRVARRPEDEAEPAR